MKSMSWICQGRLGEYHYYCPSANVDSLYPPGLKSSLSQPVIPFCVGRNLYKGWADDKDCESCDTGNSDCIKCWEAPLPLPPILPPHSCNVTSEVNYCLSDSARLQTADWTLSPSCLWADSVHFKVQVLIKFYKLTWVFSSFFLSIFFSVIIPRLIMQHMLTGTGDHIRSGLRTARGFTKGNTVSHLY